MPNTLTVIDLEQLHANAKQRAQRIVDRAMPCAAEFDRATIRELAEFELLEMARDAARQIRDQLTPARREPARTVYINAAQSAPFGVTEPDAEAWGDDDDDRPF